jgi:hypothetical protein
MHERCGVLKITALYCTIFRVLCSVQYKLSVMYITCVYYIIVQSNSRHNVANHFLCCFTALEIASGHIYLWPSALFVLLVLARYLKDPLCLMVCVGG